MLEGGVGGFCLPDCLLVFYFPLACLCVIGIDSLVRSLKEALQLTNLEVPKQGLLLLTEILER